MYSIGDFSRINRITPKTLRHYDRIGLLKPARTDDWTGYRYYDPGQLPDIRKILSLKELGFSLSEIREILSVAAPVQTLLERREAELKRSIRNDTARLEKVREYLARIKTGESMTNDVELKALPEVIVASMRTTIPGYDTYFEIVPRMGEYMQSVGAVCREPAYCFTIYHDGEYRENDIDVEICEAVVAPCAESDRIKFKKIDAVETAACLVHAGPYDRIGETYNLLFEWIESNGLAAVGNPRESYIDGIWNTDDPEKWTTEVQVPVEKREGR
ncbi:MAG: MerR family transcriptional regulator [Spirochaetaceae bacterium]|nr:MAG: MerR family transcriptional regulator [Spirochaetaceae bacterium]